MDPFSAALGIGTSLLGTISAGRQAAADRALAYEQLAAQREDQSRQYQLAYDAQQALEEENDYRRRIEQQNRRQAQSEREYEIGEMEAYKRTLAEERKREVERQITADREQAKLSAFRLQTELDNRALTREERRFAREQLARAQAIAEGERDDDMRRFYEARLEKREGARVRASEVQRVARPGGRRPGSRPGHPRPGRRPDRGAPARHRRDVRGLRRRARRGGAGPRATSTPRWRGARRSTSRTSTAPPTAWPRSTRPG